MAVHRSSRAVVATFPSWLPLNNAIVLDDDPATRSVVASETARVYADAGIDLWALWVASCAMSLDAPDRAQEVPGLERDTTTLVMQAVLPPGLRAHDDVVEASLAAIVRLANEEPVPAHELGAPETTPGLSAWARWWSTGRRWSAPGPSSTTRTAASTPSGRCRPGGAGGSRARSWSTCSPTRNAEGRERRACSRRAWGNRCTSRWDSRPSAGTRNGSRTDRLAHAESRGHAGVVAVDVSTEITIDRPVEVVAAFAAEPANVPEWYENIESVEWRTGPPLAVGSRMEFVARFLGRRLRYTYEVAEHVPGERFVMRTAEGPFPMETTYTWTAEGTATRMTLRNRGEPSGFSRFVAPMMAPAIRRANRKDLQRLKSRLEAS